MSERLHRMVDGVRVDLTPEEEAAVRAEWANAPPEPIAPISQRQLRLWLIRRGVTEEMVEGAIAQIPDATQRAEALIEWRASNAYERGHPFVGMIGAMLGFDAAQMDAGWREAVRL
jgi:hypothetical protein